MNHIINNIMRKPIKRIGIIHDLISVGKAGMTNILPVISMLGVEPCPLPTMVFSAHTGYNNPYKMVLKNFIKNSLDMFINEGIYFDFLLVGYIGDRELFEEVKEFIKYYKSKGTKIMLDPIFADNGKIYRNLNEDYIKCIKELLQYADIIVPNITEAKFLTEKDNLNDIIEVFKSFGLKNIIITGVNSKYDKLEVASYSDGKLNIHSLYRIEANLHGTGDLFAGLMVTYLTKGLSIIDAVNKSHEFICKVIKKTLEYDYDYREGIMLESFINENLGGIYE